MREIKFRGKRVDNGEWAYGYYTKKIVGKFDMRTYSEEPKDFIITGFSSGGIAHVEVDPETVGEFAGLHDKNGKEIYEGDVVGVTLYSYTEPLDSFTASVEYADNRCAFVFKETFPQICLRTLDEVLDIKYLYTHELEVTGNVHEQKETAT